MFEDSLVEARVRAADGQSAWLMLGSTVWQVALAAGLLVLPLLRPQGLAARVWAVRSAPLLRVPQAPPKARPVPVTHLSLVRVPAGLPEVHAALRPVTTALPRIRTEMADPLTEPVLAMPTTDLGAGGEVLSRLTAGAGSGSGATVAPDARSGDRRGALRVSSGVAAGLLVMPIRPVYPPIAARAGVQGVVVVEAVIARSGAIESAQVVSGPALLREAALAAVRTARYQPYRLNGEPVEVQTTISIHFNLGGGA